MNDENSKNSPFYYKKNETLGEGCINKPCICPQNFASCTKHNFPTAKSPQQSKLYRVLEALFKLVFYFYFVEYDSYMNATI